MTKELFIRQYEENLVSGNLEKLCEKAEKLKNLFITAAWEGTNLEIQTTLKSNDNRLEALANYLGLDSDEKYQKIYYYAVMRTILELNSDLADIAENHKELLSIKQSCNYKWMYSVLEVLIKNHTQSQGNIARALDISTNSLSNFFRKTNRFGFWRSKKEGKYNYYTITAKGKQAYKVYLKNETLQNKDDWSTCLLFYLDAISNEIDSETPNIDNIIRTIDDQYGRGAVSVDSETIKLKLKTLFLKSENGFRKRINNKSINFEPYMLYDDNIKDYNSEIRDYKVVIRDYKVVIRRDIDEDYEREGFGKKVHYY